MSTRTQGQLYFQRSSVTICLLFVHEIAAARLPL